MLASEPFLQTWSEVRLFSNVVSGHHGNSASTYFQIAKQSSLLLPVARSSTKSEAPWRYQTIATVLIIIHLFALTVGVITNAGGGKSFFGQSLYRIPFVHKYLSLLTMNLGYDFELSGTKPEQGVYKLRLFRNPKSGDQLGDVLGELPDDTTWPPIRRQRFRQLAYNVAFFDRLYAENADLRTQLVSTIAERWIKDLKLEHGTYMFQCAPSPSVRLPKALESAPAPIKEGGPAKKESGPAPPIDVILIWDDQEGRYLATRPAPLSEQSPVADANADAQAAADHNAADAASADKNPPHAADSSAESDSAPLVDPSQVE